MVQTEKSATLSTLQDQTLFVAEPPRAYSFDSLASNSMKSSNPHSGCREVEIAKTLDTSLPDPAKNQGGIAIVEPTFCIQGNTIDRADTAGANGTGVKEDVCYTLNTIDRPAVAFALDCRNMTANEELSKANWYKDKFLSLGGDDKLLKIVPDNANATTYQQMGGNACIEKEAMSHES